jgi:hypothetical protein
LAAIAEEEEWAGDEIFVYEQEDGVQSALGGGEPGQAIVSVWWD